MRRGPASDLPNPTLDDGEFGFTTDTGRLFIGQESPTNGQPNYNRVTFPYQNVEVITETVPLSLFSPAIQDNQLGFIASVPLTESGSYLPFQTYNRRIHLKIFMSILRWLVQMLPSIILF